jgi:hypothetical protein
MSTCWEILEIHEDATLPDIRRAYAKKLKSTRPDSDPGGFMALREAFEQAKWHANSSAEPVNFSGNISVEPNESLELPDPQTKPLEGDLHALLEATDKLIQDPEKRAVHANWEAILDSAENLTVDDMMIFEEDFFYILLAGCQKIDKEETIRSRRGRYRHPTIMEAKTGRLIFQFFWLE